ncbi:MAG: competence/damage-inducible protein A [Deltaproteobacteria bacterium]|nr:competence/damage-inducible protein A [Deltaproteobacteria bacterium]MBW2419798.1 competence/damage-inducible protein A [Deltaproteobacteria bacterium]
MKAEIVTIGDEVMRGEIIDSNKAHLSECLVALHIETHFQTSVRDDPDDMSEAFHRAVGRADVVLVSGGLGPTRDDRTAEVLSQSFARELELHEPSLKQIRDFFRALGREMSENNEKQAWLPSGAEVLPNPIGTAPGFLVEEKGALVFCMPGVPREMKRMMEEQVIPRIAARRGGAPVLRATLLRTFGLGESSLDAELRDIALGESVELGFRTSFPDNYLRPVARAASVEEADALLDGISREIRERLGTLVYGEGDETLEAVVGRMLGEQGKTIALAESCTGGLLAKKITDIPGSSEYFAGGVVAYANAAKIELLGVPEALLAEHGAVSDPVAVAMAEGVRGRFAADIGVATTGISGPGGGTQEKPVGLVSLALAHAGGTHVDHFVFGLDRARHRVLTVQIALDWVRRLLLGTELIGPSLLRRQGGAAPPGGISVETLRGEGGDGGDGEEGITVT